jgi:tetratricopeptide (TPR) repeat protein
MKTAFLACVVRCTLALSPVDVLQAQAPPADPDAQFAKGVQLHQGGDYLGAIEAYQAAIELDPSRIDARSNLGAAFVKLGRYEEGIKHYQAVLQRVPEQVQVRFNLALALYKSARISEAADELDRVVATDSANRSAVLLLADCRTQMGNDVAVVDLLGPRDQEFKDDKLYAYLLGNALIRRSELLRGQAYIDRLFRGGESAEAHLLMGVAHLRRSDFRAALPDLQRALELNAALAGVQSLLGRALMGMGRRDEAMVAFRRELDKNPNDFDANLYLGLFLKDDLKLDEAYAHLTRAERLRPQDTGVLYALGSAHLAAGRVDEAQKALETVTQKAPSYRQAHVLLATVYYRQKKKDLGDRERQTAETLRAAEQAREPGAVDELGPAYKGDAPAPPTGAAPKDAPKESRP